jgi:hypothetical protein
MAFLRLGSIAVRPAVLVVLSCLGWGCTTAATTSRVKEVASSGVAYGNALEGLLAATEQTAVDASSARALSQGQGVKTTSSRARILEGQDKAIEPLLSDFEKLRRHARLFKRYFQSLSDLADNAADESAARAVAGSAEALEKLGRELEASASLGSDAKAALSKVTALVVQGVREQAIARELTARASVIDHQLAIHKELLLALRDKLKSDTRDIYDVGVKAPFEMDAVRDPKDWMLQRRTYLLVDRKIEAFEKASDAASRLRTAWKAYVENSAGGATLTDLLRDVEAAVALAESGKGSS